MKNFFYLFLLWSLPQLILAQSPANGCGFEPDEATIQWMNSHHQAIERFHADPSTRNQLRAIKRVPLKFVAFNSGKTASLSQADVNLAVTNLNKAFQPMGIEFFSCHPPLNVLSSPYGSYLVSEEKALWQEFKTTKVINVFCVESIEYGSVAGYTYLPGSGAPEAIFMLKNHLSQATFAHEMGHYYGLYHTHGKSNCETLTDELVKDPNCARTGDDVCDTPADPNLQGIGCNTILVNSATCAYTGTARDKNGDLYQPNPRNIMSYSWTKCVDYFSPGQYERMQYFSRFRVYPEECPAEICAIPSINKIDSTYNSVQLVWTAFAQDSLYQVRYRTLGDTSWKTQNLTSNQWSLKNLKPCTKLEVQVRRACGGGFSNWSPLANLKTQGCGGVYCASFGHSTNAWLNRVSIDPWGYTSGDNDGYLLNQNSGLSLSAGVQYTIQFDPGGTFRIRDTLHWQVWIDKNRDRDFEDAGERIYQGKSPHRSSHKGLITLPTELNAGSSRLRIILSLNNWASDPCDTSAQVIETEDYVVTLRSQQICNTPGVNNILLKKVTTNAVTIKTQGLDVSRYQWELRQSSNSQLVYLSPELTPDSLYFLGLVENVRYKARLRTLCKSGVYSSWSDTLSFKTLAIPCAAPDSITLVVKQITSLAAQLNCGTQVGVSYYQFHYRAKGTETWINSPLVRLNNYYISGLKAGTIYEYRARVYCSTNLTTVSAYSKTAKFTTLAACSAPDSSSLKVSQLSYQSTVLQCGAVGGAVLYEFFYRVRNSTIWLNLQRTSAPTITLQGLKANTAYEFRVRVYCNSSLTEASGYSKISSFQTSPEPCKLPNRDLIRVAIVGDSVLQFLYSDTSKYYQSYLWRFRKKGITTWTILPQGVSAVKIPEFGADFEVTLQGVCGPGDASAWSLVKTFNTPCEAPKSSNLYALELRFSHARIFYRGAKSTGFLWQYKALNEANWSAESFNSDTITYVSNLKPLSTYQFRLKTRCSSGVWSAFSSPFQFSIPSYPCDFPDSTTFNASSITDVSAKLSCDTVPGVVFYIFSYRKVGTLPWTSLFVNNAPETLATNLQPNSTYEYTVQSGCRHNNELAISLVLAYRQFVTLPKICPPVAYSNVQVQYLSGKKMQATCPPGAEAYVWRLRRVGAESWTDSISLDTPVWTIPNLRYPEQYEIQVKQKCIAGNWSAWSSSKKFFTPELACPKPDLRNIKILVIGDNVQFLYIEGQFTRYHWRYRILGDSVWAVIPDSVFQQGLVLDQAANYEVALQVSCANGESSEWSESKMFFWPCPKIKDNEIVIKELNAHYAHIACAAPSIDGYHWRYRQVGKTWWEKEVFSLNEEVLFDKLAGEKTYEFQVRRSCSDFDGAFSDTLFFSTPPLQSLSSCTLTPDQINIKEVESGKIELTCSLTAKKYFWTYRKQDASDWAAQLPSTTGMINFDRLAYGVAYTIGVQAICLAGDTTDWVYLSYYPSCSDIKVTDVKIETPTDKSVLLKCTNYNFSTYEWRYRSYGSTDNWIYAVGNDLKITQLIEKLYEVQVRGFCQQIGTWTSWSSLYQFSVGICKLPSSLVFVPKFIDATTVDILLESNSSDWKAAHYKWSYRELGRRNWIDTIITEETSLSLFDLIPGARYELKVEVICFAGTPSSFVYSNYITMPTGCFVPALDRVKVGRITQTAAFIELDYNLYLPFTINYRVKGSQTAFQTIDGLRGIVPNLTGLIPATEYEMVVGINCNGNTLQTPAIYFKTKSCDIPYAGAVVVNSINLDYIEANVEFHNFHPASTGLNYIWKYKLKNSTNWDSISTGNQNTLYLDGLQPESFYDLKVVLHCPNSFADSIQFSTSFKTVLDKCSSIEGSENVINRYDTNYKQYFITCTLPSEFYYSIRFWIRFDREVTNNYWEFAVSDSLNCGRASFNVDNEEGQNFYYQARILCPDGNYSPWSDTFFLDFKNKQLNADLAKGQIDLSALETSLLKKLQLWPNPTSGQFNLLIPPGVTGDLQLTILSADGRKVLAKQLEDYDQGPLGINLSSQPSGVYFVRVQAGQKVYTERIVIGAGN